MATSRQALFRAVIDASRRGDRSGMERAGEVLLAAAPGDPAALGLVGTLACQAGDVERGCALLVRGLGHAPGNRDLRHNAIRALFDLGRLDEAVTLCGDDTATLLALGRALNLAGRSREALVPLSAAMRVAPADPEILVALGLTQANLGGFIAAERAYRLALEAAPEFGPAVLNLGILLEQSNRADELAGLTGVREHPYLRALIERHAGRFAEALALAETVGDEVDASLRAQLIGQLAERLGQSETAFAAFEAMNRAVAADPASRVVNAAEYREGIEARTARLTPARVSGWSRIEIELARPAPVFLVGFPRSGTTLLDTILMGHPGVAVLEEEPVLQRVQEALGDPARLGELTSEEANALRTLYFEALDERRGTAGRLMIDKLPLNIVRAELIHRIFPDARFLLALRDPRDAVLSCFMQNFKINAAMANFLDLGDAARLYATAFRHWQRCAELLPLNVHTIRYEDLLDDPEAVLRPLMRFLGLEWDDRLLAHTDTAAKRGLIRTPSYGQVTQPLYRRAAGRWTRYAKQLAPVLPLLDPWARRWGYAAGLPHG